MKKNFIIIGALFFCSFLSAKNLEHNLVMDVFNSEYEYSENIETISFLKFKNINYESTSTLSIAKVDCVIRITGTFDGVEIDLEITIHDVTWVGCKLLQAGIRAME
jgi:hypothetical protein